MRIFVINLLRRPDRLVEISHDLKHHAITFETVEAIDATSNPLAKKFHRPLLQIILGKRAYSIGTTANFLSHRQIWQKMVSENIPSVLVLEDDARISNWDKRFLDLDISQYGLDILRLGANEVPVEQTPASTKTILGRALVTGQLWGNVATIVTLSAAKKFLVHNKYWFPSDDYEHFKYCYGIKYAAVNPLLWLASGSASDVETTKKKLSIFQSISLSVIKPLRRKIILPAIQLYLRFITSSH